MDTDTTARDVVVAEWDGGLALRLPADIAGRLHLKAGDTLRLVEIAGGGLHVEKADKRQELKKALERFRLPLPSDYRFDRDDANDR